MLGKLKQLDQWILFILLVFMAASTLLIYSATTHTRFDGIYKTNLITFGILLIVTVFLSLIDYRVWIHKLSWWLYGIGMILLLYVKFKGMDINGSRRWINLHVMQLQPSELMKVFVILFLAHVLSKRQGLLRLSRDLVPILLLVLVPFYFVLEQPDMGTSIVFLGIMVGMLWVGGIRKLHALLGIGILASIILILTALYHYDFALFNHIIKPHQLARIQTFLDPNADPNSSWHVKNSITAIGSGGLTGDGYLKGTFVHEGFIPYDYADSIFVVVGEEFGFLGAAVLIMLYFILVYRMIQIALRTKDPAGIYMIIGIISMLCLQIFVNVSMHTGLLPLTGIDLPFISYGGSSLLTEMLSIALVLSVSLHPNSLQFDY